MDFEAKTIDNTPLVCYNIIEEVYEQIFYTLFPKYKCSSFDNIMLTSIIGEAV